MPSKFSIIRYVPNPIAAEQINIGVVAFDANRIKARFLHSWDRVRAFGAEDPTFLRDFAETFSKEIKVAQPLLYEAGRPKLIERIAARWTHSIQFSEPRASLLSVDDLLKDIASRVLWLRSMPEETK